MLQSTPARPALPAPFFSTLSYSFCPCSCSCLPVLYPEDRSIAAVVFPTADRLKQIQVCLANEASPRYRQLPYVWAWRGTGKPALLASCAGQPALGGASGRTTLGGAPTLGWPGTGQ